MTDLDATDIKRESAAQLKKAETGLYFCNTPFAFLNESLAHLQRGLLSFEAGGLWATSALYRPRTTLKKRSVGI
jgi:hypothetical protein